MDTQHFKSKLEEEKKLLESELSRLGIKDPKTGDWGAILEEQDESEQSDMVDRGDRDEDFTVRANTLGELEIRYNNILRAMKKIEEEGGYGICEISGQPIEEDRLEANPSARTCKAHMGEEDTLEQ